MSRTSTRLFKAALSALHYTGLGSLVAPFTRGNGVIFTLHHVQPRAAQSFDPNGFLNVTPDFLDRVIRQVKAAGFECVSLDEAVERISGRQLSDRPFAHFTFDDGYRDNRDHALPVLRRHGVPFTIYVPTDYPDGRGELWWLALEEVIRISAGLVVQMSGEIRRFVCVSAAEKKATFEHLYWWLRGLPEHRMRQVVRELAAGAGVDLAAMCRALVMTWDELREVAADPLATIGAHTMSHYAVAKLSDAEARAEIVGSVERIERELGKPCRHFSYPYGDEASAGPRDFAICADLGLATAVTTRKGLITGAAGSNLTGLNRVSLNGDYQQARYIDVMLTGAPFAFLNLVRRAPEAL